MEAVVYSELSIPWISVGAIICIACLIILSYQLYCTTEWKANSESLNDEERNNARLSRSLIMTCVIASTLCQICDLTRWVSCYALNKSLFYYPLHQIMASSDLFYYIGCISFYSIAVSRIYFAFYGSHYAIKRVWINLYLFLLMISIIAAIFYCIIVALQPKQNPDQFFITYNTPTVIILSLNDFILNVTLLILFVSKLRKIMTQTLITNEVYQVLFKNKNPLEGVRDLMLRPPKQEIYW